MIEAYKRDKIPSYLSYPLKFEELVTSLGATGEEISGKVWFNAINAPRQNQKRVRYPLIETQFWSHRPEAPWYFLVNPIPRSLRETVHSLLVSEGVGRLGEWLAARKNKSAKYPGGLHTHRPSLRISYVVSGGLLDYEPA